MRLRNVQEFCRYPDLLRHSLSFIEGLTRTFLAGCVKTIKLSLRGNESRGGLSTPIDRECLRYGDDCHLSIQGLC